MESSIYSALRTIVNQILAKIQVHKDRSPFLGTDGELFLPEIWLSDLEATYVQDFIDIYNIDKNISFFMIFNKITSYVASLVNSRTIQDVGIVEVIIYDYLLRYVSGCTFRVSEELTFNKFLDDCTKITIQNPQKQVLIRTLASIANHFIDNGAIPIVKSLSSITNVTDFVNAIQFYLQLNKAIDITFESMAGFYRQLSTENRIQYYELLKTMIPDLYRKCKHLHVSPYSARSRDLLNIFWSLKPIREGDLSEFLILLMSLSLNSKENSDCVNTIVKKVLEVKKLSKLNPPAQEGFNHVIASTIIRGMAANKDIAFLKSNFENYYTNSKNKAKLQEIVDTIVPKYLSYDIISAKGAETGFQTYIIPILSGHPNPMILPQSVEFVLKDNFFGITYINAELLKNYFHIFFNKTANVNPEIFTSCFFNTFSTPYSLIVLSQYKNLYSKYFELMNKYASTYFALPNFSQNYLKALINLFKQTEILPDPLQLMELFLNIDMFIQRLILTYDPMLPYASILIDKFISWTNKSKLNDGLSEMGKSIISISAILDVIFDTNTVDSIKTSLGLDENWSMHSSGSSDIYASTVIKCLNIWLALVSSTTGGKCQTTINYKIQGNFNILIAAPLVEYIFKNCAAILSHKRIDIIEKPPVKVFYESLFVLFGFGKGGLSQIIEKSKFIEKASTPSLLDAALESLKEIKLDSSPQAKKHWSQTLKLLSAAMSTKEAHSYSSSQLEQFVVYILQDLQLCDGLESDIIKQPILALITALYENFPKVSTVRRMCVAYALVYMIQNESKNHTRSIPRCLKVLEKVFIGFRIEPSDSSVYGNISNYDTLSYTLEKISHFFAVLIDCLINEIEDEIEVRQSFSDLIYTILINNVDNVYPIYMYYARMPDSILSRVFNDTMMKYLKNDNKIKYSFYIKKLSKDGYEIFKNPPINCISFYMAAIKHVIANMKGDVIFDMMANELKTKKNIRDEVIKNFFAVWFYICATPQVVETCMKAINIHKSFFRQFIPHGSFPYYLKELSLKSGFSVTQIFRDLFILPILQTPLPFGYTFWEVNDAESISEQVLSQMKNYFTVVESVSVSYFAPPFPVLSDEIKMLHHFLDELPAHFPDCEKYTRCDPNFLALYNSRCLISIDKRIERRKYWLLTTKYIPKEVSLNDIIEFSKQTIQHSNEKSVNIILDAEVDCQCLMDNFSTYIQQLGNKIASVSLLRCGIGLSTKIMEIRDEKFDLMIDQSILDESVMPMQLYIPELNINGELNSTSNFRFIILSNSFQFFAVENGMDVFSSINFVDLTDISVNRNILHLHANYRDIRFSSNVANQILKLIENFNKEIKTLSLPRSDLTIDPLLELVSIAFHTVSSTESELSSQGISLFFAALKCLEGKTPFVDPYVNTQSGFAIPHINFSKLISEEYRYEMSAILSLSKIQTKTSSILTTILETINSEDVPSSMLAIIAQSTVRFYSLEPKAQATAKELFWTKISSSKFVYCAIPIIAQFCEAKQFADLVFCLLKRNTEAIYDSLFTRLIKNEISLMTFYKFVMKPSCLWVISNVYPKSKDLFQTREATSLYIMAIGLAMYPAELLPIFKTFFTQYLTFMEDKEMLAKFNQTKRDPKAYLSIVYEVAAKSNEYDLFLKYIDVTAHSGYPDPLVLASDLTEMQSIAVIKRAFQSKNEHRLIYNIETVTEYIYSYKKYNVQPLFLIWAIFPLLQSNSSDLKLGALKLILAIFHFTKDVMNYPTILDIASSINQSDLLINAMESFYDSMYQGFEDGSTNFEAYFGIALAGDLVGPLADQKIKKAAIEVLQLCLDNINIHYESVYFVAIAAAMTDIDLSKYLGDQSFSDYICEELDKRTPYEALFIAQTLFLGLITREDKTEFFTTAMIAFFKIRTEIPAFTSKYMLNILTPMLDKKGEESTRLQTLSKLIAIAMTALPFNDQGFKDLNNPAAPIMDDNDLGYHFEDLATAVEDAIMTSYVNEF